MITLLTFILFVVTVAAFGITVARDRLGINLKPSKTSSLASVIEIGGVLIGVIGLVLYIVSWFY